MNKQRSKRIYDVIEKMEAVDVNDDLFKNKLSAIKSEIEHILFEEENYFDNMPENLQGSMRGEEAEEAIEYLTEAVDAIESALKETDIQLINEALEEAVDNLNYI